MNSTQNDRFLPPGEVISMTSLSRSTIWRLSRAGAFPQPVRLSPNRVGWSRAAVVEWMEARTHGG